MTDPVVEELLEKGARAIALTEQAAKHAADTLNPPYDYEDWDRKLQADVIRRREVGPDDQAYLKVLAGDGHKSIRAATYREVARPVVEFVAARVEQEVRQQIAAELMAEGRQYFNPHARAAFRRAAIIVEGGPDADG